MKSHLWIKIRNVLIVAFLNDKTIRQILREMQFSIHHHSPNLEDNFWGLSTIEVNRFIIESFIPRNVLPLKKNTSHFFSILHLYISKNKKNEGYRNKIGKKWVKSIPFTFFMAIKYLYEGSFSQLSCYCFNIYCDHVLINPLNASVALV